jgi:hypothetical protein
MRNWVLLDEPERAGQARTWLRLSIVQQLSQFSVPFIAHPLFKGLMWLFPLLYFAIWYFSFARQQRRYLKQNALDDYARKPWTKVLTLSTVGFVLYVSLGVAFLGIASYTIRSNTEQAPAAIDDASPNPYAKFVLKQGAAPEAPQDSPGTDANAVAPPQPAQQASVTDQDVRPAAALQDYANREFSFAFRYPASWVPTAPETPNTRVHFISPPGSAIAACVVVVIRRPDIDHLDQASIDAIYRQLPSTAELQGGLAQNLQALEVIGVKAGALGPLPAYDIHATYFGGSGASAGFFSGRLVTAASPGYTWTMSCGGSGSTPAAAEQAYKVWEDDIEQVIRSFKFL